VETPWLPPARKPAGNFTGFRGRRAEESAGERRSILPVSHVTRAIVTLSGRVQAVGFRDTVRRIAARYDVAGTVRNMRAGERLEIDVEGADDAVRAFLDDVLAHPPRYARVEHVERRTADPGGRHAFVIAPTS
jgi:acylphosphatase